MNIERNKWIIFYVTVIGNFLALFDSTTVNIALYEISQDFNIDITQVQWVYTIYMLTLTAFLPFFGKLGDIFKRNKVYACGFAFFAIGAFLSFTAKDYYTLLIYRAIEGLGASIILSNAIAIISSIFKGVKRGQAMGMLGAICAIAGMSGPAIGGILMDKFGWNAIFLPTVPLAIIGAILSYKLVPSLKIHDKFKFDYKGFVLFSLFLISLLLFISQGNTWGWTSKNNIVLIIISLISALLFYFREHSITYPMVDFKMFHNHTILWGDISLLTCYIAMFSNGVLFPFFAQEILHYSSLKTGLLILPFSIVVLILAPIIGKIAGKFGSKYLTLAGGIVIAIGLTIFAFCDENTTPLVIILGQAISGAGSALFQSPSNTAVMSASDTKHLGITSGFVALSRNLGMIMGVAITISLFDLLRETYLIANNPFDTAFIKAYHLALIPGIILGLTSGFIAYNAFKRQKIS